MGFIKRDEFDRLAAQVAALGGKSAPVKKSSAKKSSASKPAKKKTTEKKTKKATVKKAAKKWVINIRRQMMAPTWKIT